MSGKNELAYYDALRRIGRYMTTEQLQRNAEKEYDGVTYHEALEMAYDNIKAEAADVLKGKRRPKVATAPALAGPKS